MLVLLDLVPTNSCRLVPQVTGCKELVNQPSHLMGSRLAVIPIPAQVNVLDPAPRMSISPSTRTGICHGTAASSWARKLESSSASKPSTCSTIPCSATTDEPELPNHRRIDCQQRGPRDSYRRRQQLRLAGWLAVRSHAARQQHRQPRNPVRPEAHLVGLRDGGRKL